MRSSERFALRLFAVAAILPCGPTRIGSMIPREAASSVAPSEVASQGCATATFSRGRAFAAASSRSYFSCLRVSTGARCGVAEDATTLSSCLPRSRHLAALLCESSDAICPTAASQPGTRRGCATPQYAPDDDRDDLTALAERNPLTVHKHPSS